MISKYGNKKTEYNGILFDSKKEAERYMELKQKEDDGDIEDLILQPKFELIPKFEHSGVKYRKMSYVADFQYEEDGQTVVEDVKGFLTDSYRLKKKMFLYQYQGFKFIET